MQQFDRNTQERSHPTFAVDAQDFEAFAAVRTVQKTGVAMSATDIWLDSAFGAGLDPPVVRRRAEHFDAEFVAENPWISEEGLASGEGV